MYLCLVCRRIFDEPERCTETHGLDCPPYEEWMGCPHCAGAYVETMACECCGNWITGEYIELADGSAICEECYEIKHIED
jgi:hypothetical protein